ncbi:BppU family phage baseplate upper protein [Enterococcus faecium]|uniref:BppU family phage baseplate upper protein n=1 Tax=Enterococcus faecium TaxID=1352 RepID=UPI001CE14DF2|nr:BppU family phage baseplate upper protein [Enterococcus faecium]
MVDRKVGEITVPTEPVSRATKITGFTFKSYDKNAGVLQFNIENQDGSPTDLIDATVRLFMYIYQGEEKKEFPIFDNQIITESYMQGIVKYRIPDMLLSYEGKVDANVYIDFPDGSHTDNLAFTFNIEKSIIDGDVQLNGEYYFKDFQQLLDGVKQEATDAVNEVLAKVDSSTAKMQELEQRIDEQTEIFNNADVYNKAEIEDKLEPFALRTDIDTLEIKKADKTALSQTNILLANGLNSKVDKGGNEQISMGMLTTEVKKAMTGGSVAVVDNGAVNTSAMVDNAATAAKRTRLGEMGLVTIFNGARMDFDFVNRKITIPAIANIINRKDKYEKNTMTELPFLQGISSQSLVYDVSIKDFRLIGSSDISSFNENMLLLAHINTAAGYISSPSDYTVNGTKAEDRYYNYVAYYGGLISSQKIGSSVKLFFSTPLEKIYIKTRNSSKIIIVENQELEIPHNYSLVVDFNENILKIVDSDRINYAFQMPLVTVHNGLIKYSALLISNATTHTYDSVVAYPAGEILSQPVGSGVKLTFTGIDRNSSFYVKTRTGNHIINLKLLSIFDQSSNSITVPHNSSLVFNDILKTLEIINSDLIERDKHIVFITVHNGLIKWNVGLRLVNQNQSVPQIEYRRPINKRDLYVSQGGCVVGNQLWLFEDAGATHKVEKRIWRLNANDLSDIDTIPHTMAHCNGVDFIDGYLLVFNGAATPPEINITKNVTEETASLYFGSSENTQIVFKEGSKQLEGDGSACFGEDFNIVYYAGYAGIYKILLGTGENDLSDKTVDKSDMSSWGTFISGRSIDEYNGTARILRTYTGPSLGQPQDMFFDGKLYIQRDYSTLNYSALTFNDDTYSYSVSERVEIDVRDENYNKMHIEPEAITFYKNKIIMGGRGEKNILASIYRK